MDRSYFEGEVESMRARKGEGVWRRRYSKKYLALFLLLTFVEIIAIPVIGDDATAWLTAEERAWIAAHPVITVAPDPDFPPIEYFDEDGEYQGLAADYLALVERETGLNFKVVRCASWDEVLAKTRAREVDALSAAAQTPQRADYLLFSDPHIVLQGVIIARQQVKGTLTLDDPGRSAGDAGHRGARVRVAGVHLPRSSRDRA
jgi:ABC-type amino acid transport substrate-binding protein